MLVNALVSLRFASLLHFLLTIQNQTLPINITPRIRLAFNKQRMLNNPKINVNNLKVSGNNPPRPAIPPLWHDWSFYTGGGVHLHVPAEEV